MPSQLTELGRRICILGPSNSGKSTLADAIARAHGLLPVHLDQLHHRPDTDWQPRPEAEFLALHDMAIAGDSWVTDGNYTRCLPQRLERATGLILLDVGTATSLLRYIRRTLRGSRARVGGIPGGPERLRWEMMRYIATTTRANRRRYAAQFGHWPLPGVSLPSARAIRAFYVSEGLDRFGRRAP